MSQSRRYPIIVQFAITANCVILRAHEIGAINMWWLIGGIVVYFLGSGVKHALYERRIRRTLEPGAGLSTFR